MCLVPFEAGWSVGSELVTDKVGVVSDNLQWGYFSHSPVPPGVQSGLGVHFGAPPATTVTVLNSMSAYIYEGKVENIDVVSDIGVVQ